MKTPFEIHRFYAVAQQRNKRGLKTYFLKSTFHYVDGYCFRRNKRSWHIYCDFLSMKNPDHEKHKFLLCTKNAS